MMLEEIGFYTLSDKRAINTSAFSPMWRCEMILTHQCNFSCVYCRGLRNDCIGDMPLERAIWVLNRWADDGLKNLRFSGGEPMLYPHLSRLVSHANSVSVERIAISTNGSFPLPAYMNLVELGVNDFSISLDACCASMAEVQANAKGFWNTLTVNIRELSQVTYVTVGVVLTDDTVSDTADIVSFAHDLGVDDIRIISAAQWNSLLVVRNIPENILDVHPILRYRVGNMLAGRNVRGIQETDAHKCWLMQDDSIVAGRWHFPCVIYFREQGDPVGHICDTMREDRIRWLNSHDTFNDPICRRNCLDVCIDYNNAVNKRMIRAEV